VDDITKAFNEGKFDLLDKLVAADFVGHTPFSPEDLKGREALKGFFAATHAAFSDLRHPGWTLIAEGDLVSIHMALEGTFTNEFMGIPPNGKKVVVWMHNLWRIADGKAVEWWFYADTLGFMQQLGAIPPMGEA
jgi:steroid delta-isomerase-like uncharacterized protein